MKKYKKQIISLFAISIFAINVTGCSAEDLKIEETSTEVSTSDVITSVENTFSETETNEESSTISQNGKAETESTDFHQLVSPQFKETMDSYEAFFNDYVEFMKKYSSSSNPLDMLNDYNDYLSKYADMMSKLNSIDQTTLSTADALYYAEVTARMSQNLLSVSASY